MHWKKSASLSGDHICICPEKPSVWCGSKPSCSTYYSRQCFNKVVYGIGIWNWTLLPKSTVFIMKQRLIHLLILFFFSFYFCQIRGEKRKQKKTHSVEHNNKRWDIKTVDGGTHTQGNDYQTDCLNGERVNGYASGVNDSWLIQGIHAGFPSIMIRMRILPNAEVLGLSLRRNQISPLNTTIRPHYFQNAWACIF